MVLDNTQDIYKAIKMQIPMAVITEKDSQCHQEALKYLSPAAVIYYSNGKMHSDERVFSISEGLTIQTLNEICQFINENQICPNIYVWQPRKKPVKPNIQPIREPVQQQPQQNIRPMPEPVQPQQEYSPAQIDFNSFINNKEIIAVFKSTPNANSEAVAQEIAQRSNAGYLKVGSQLMKSTTENAYSDGNIVNYNANFTPDRLIVEVDAQITNAMEAVYTQASKIIHVCCANVELGMQAVKDWAASGFKLDAVIPDSNSTLSAYKAGVPKALSIEEFVASL